MKKILLATSAIVAMASMGASAHVRDGLVSSNGTNFELTIQGEVSAYQAYTHMFKYEDKNGNDLMGAAKDNHFGQDYSADIDFIARAHARSWEIEGRVEIDVNSASADKHVKDINGNYKDHSNFVVDEAYLDFKHASVGMFRLGKGPAPSDMLSLEAALPGENFDNGITFLDKAKRENKMPLFDGLGNARFASDANQIGYYSPKFGDMFSFGVAYIFGEGNNVNSDTLYNDVEDDAVEIAALFDKEFGAFSLGFSGAYRQHFNSDVVGNIDNQWTTGLKLGYLGFDWITTYGQKDYNDIDRRDWGARTALTYGWDRWEVGAVYEYGKDNTRTINTITSQLVEASAEYTIIKGLSVFGSAGYAWGENEGGDEASGMQVRTGIDLTW